VAKIDADLRSSRRIMFRTGAVVLAVVGVAAFFVRPSRGSVRAEARFRVPSPLAVDEVVDAMRSDAGAAVVTTAGRRVTVVSKDADSVVARVHALELMRAGLDEARQRLNAVQNRRADAARRDRSQAAAQLDAIASHTGLTDPESAYEARAEVVRNLEEQRAQTAAAGRPLAAIDAQLAENQEALFDLQLQVTRHAELTEAINAADRRALEATRAIDATDRAVRATVVAETEHASRSGFGFAIPAGVAALVLAGIVLFVGERRASRSASRDGGADARSTPAPAGGRDPRYLDFYNALDPSAPPLEHEPASAQVDLVLEEALERGGDPEPETVAERDTSRPG
jgi:hypothetical protein